MSKIEPTDGVMPIQYLTYSGKPIEKMTWLELKRERRIQRWFARRCKRMCWAIEWGNEQRRKELEENTQVEEAQEAFERGEITELKLRQIANGRKKRYTMLEQAEESLEFLQMHQYQAEAIRDACNERMMYVTKPHPRKKNYNPRKFNSRRYNQGLRKRRYQDIQDNYHRLYAWQKEMDKRGIGWLWDKDKFLLICADRGYGSMISVHYLMSNVLGYTQLQAKRMIDQGNFTWGQVLSLGAALEMTPKEFADTFMSGYFVELAEGEFRASYKNLPDDIVNEPTNE